MMGNRIDLYPTATIAGFDVRPGHVKPYGASVVPGGINFSIFSSSGTACTLVLFDKHDRRVIAELPVPQSYRIGDVWSIIVFSLDPETFDYGYRIDGPWDPVHGERFDAGTVLIDPYARAISGREEWRKQDAGGQLAPLRSCMVPEDFDWQDDQPLEIPPQDLVIYEMHVRGFTRHPSSGTAHPGTYAGIVEKIPYLKTLGINCVELLPVFEFDEFEMAATNPCTGELKLNYWGYSTIGFFAPKAGYAATGPMGMQADEFKSMVRSLHAEGIALILDVVFNHTSEGDHRGPTLSFRGLDNRTYYMLGPKGEYLNFSGCGNSLNCNNPIVREFVLECLRFWVSEYHIDGFRFDAAAILGRDPSGTILSNPPLLESVARDPVLKKSILIAEAWDAGGLYLLGRFPSYHRFAEWNGKYRDDLRDFIRAVPGSAGALATRLSGSPDLYEPGERSPLSSINFITCHDGFTLRDLVSYNWKHNEANAEDNRDGHDDNRSWNCGLEGETDDPEINALRLRQSKNAILALMVSRGIPMLLMGDEFGRTQSGNNNAYCHDSALSWLDWTLVEREAELFRFIRLAITLRRAHPVLRSAHYQKGDAQGALGFPELSWHGRSAWEPDWSGDSRLVAAVFALATASRSDVLYYAWNTGDFVDSIELPSLPKGFQWRVCSNTGCPAGEDIFETGKGHRLQSAHPFLIDSRSSILLEATEQN